MAPFSYGGYSQRFELCRLLTFAFTCYLLFWKVWPSPQVIAVRRFRRSVRCVLCDPRTAKQTQSNPYRADQEHERRNQINPVGSWRLCNHCRVYHQRKHLRRQREPLVPALHWWEQRAGRKGNGLPTKNKCRKDRHHRATKDHQRFSKYATFVVAGRLTRSLRSGVSRLGDSRQWYIYPKLLLVQFKFS